MRLFEPAATRSARWRGRRTDNGPWRPVPFGGEAGRDCDADRGDPGGRDPRLIKHGDAPPAAKAGKLAWACRFDGGRAAGAVRGADGSTGGVRGDVEQRGPQSGGFPALAVMLRQGPEGRSATTSAPRARSGSRGGSSPGLAPARDASGSRFRRGGDAGEARDRRAGGPARDPEATADRRSSPRTRALLRGRA